MQKSYKTVPLSQIKPYPNNPRINDAAAKDVAKSIEQCGYIAPIVVDEDMVILAGHTRKLALESLGKTEADIIIVSGLSDAQKRKYRLLDNKTNELSDWNFDLLEQELADLDFGDLELDWGIDLDDEPAEAIEDDYDAEPPAEPRAKMGDIYQLGRHRLMCGDSTKREDVERLIDGAEIQLLLTDPPYGVNRDKGFGGFGGFGKPIKRREYNDDWDSEAPSKETFDLLLEIASKAIIFGGNFFTDKLPVGTHWIVWDKNNTMPTFGDCELAWTNIDRKSVKKYEVTYNGLIGKEDERYHPTQKPVAIMGAILKDYTESNDNVADLFGGSGTTLIACEQLGRTCYICEAEPKYCDVIIDRYEKFTNQKAVKIGS